MKKSQVGDTREDRLHLEQPEQNLEHFQICFLSCHQEVTKTPVKPSMDATVAAALSNVDGSKIKK